MSLDSQGVSIISAEGKTNIPPLLVLYTKLGVSTYALFDGDGDEADPKKAHTDTNKALLSLMGQVPEERPETIIFSTGAVWKNEFAETIKNEFGADSWDTAYTKACEEYSMKAGEGKKKFAVIRRTIELILKSGKNSPSLAKLWEAIEGRCQLT